MYKPPFSKVESGMLLEEEGRLGSEESFISE